MLHLPEFLLHIAGTSGGVSSSPTLKSVKHASITSFGSICLENFLFVILQVIGALLRSAVQDIDSVWSFLCRLYCGTCQIYRIIIGKNV